MPAQIDPAIPLIPVHKEDSHWESPEAAQVKELEEEIEKFRQEKEDLEKEKELEK